MFLFPPWFSSAVMASLWPFIAISSSHHYPHLPLPPPSLHPACRNTFLLTHLRRHQHQPYVCRVDHVQANCPRSSGNNNLWSVNVTTLTAFDNAYYTNLVSLRISSTPTGNYSIVQSYAASSAVFFGDFPTVMVKMGNISPLICSSGRSGASVVGWTEGTVCTASCWTQR